MRCGRLRCASRKFPSARKRCWSSFRPHVGALRISRVRRMRGDQSVQAHDDFRPRFCPLIFVFAAAYNHVEGREGPVSLQSVNWFTYRQQGTSLTCEAATAQCWLGTSSAESRRRTAAKPPAQPKQNTTKAQRWPQPRTYLAPRGTGAKFRAEPQHYMLPKGLADAWQ